LVWNVEGVGEVVEERKWRGIDVVTRKMRESLCIGTLTLPHTLFHHKIDRLPFYSFPLISRPHIPYQSITNPSVPSVQTPNQAPHPQDDDIFHQPHPLL